MTLFGKNRDLAKNRRDQQDKSGAVSDQTGVRRNQYGSMREGVGARRTARAARVAEKASNKQAEGKNLSKRQQRLADEHSYNVGRDAEKARYKHEKTQAIDKPKEKVTTSMDPVTVTPRSKSKAVSKTKTNPGSKKVNAYYTDTGGYKKQHTVDSLKKQNREAKPSSQGVTYHTNTDGSSSSRVRRNKGESKAAFDARVAEVKKNTASDPNI